MLQSGICFHREMPRRRLTQSACSSCWRPQGWRCHCYANHKAARRVRLCFDSWAHQTGQMPCTDAQIVIRSLSGEGHFMAFAHGFTPSLPIFKMSITSQVTGCDDPPFTVVQSAPPFQAGKQVVQPARTRPVMSKRLQTWLVSRSVLKLNQGPKQAPRCGPIQNVGHA